MQPSSDRGGAVVNEQVQGLLGCFKGGQCIDISPSDTVAAVTARFQAATGRTLRELRFRGFKLQSDSIIWRYLPDFHGSSSDCKAAGTTASQLAHPRFIAVVLPASVQLLIDVTAISEDAVRHVELSAKLSETVGDISRRLQAEMGLDHRFALQSIINGNGFLEDGKRFLEDTSTLERCYSEKRIPWESKVRLRLSAVRADIELHISLAQHGGTEGAASAAAVLPHAAVDAITLVVHPWERISGVVQRASRAFFPAGVPQAELHTLTKGSADVGRTTSLDSAVYDFSSKLHHGAQLSFERYVSHDSGAVYVKTLTGKTVALAAVVADTTVDKLKQMFQDAQSIPPDQQRLRWRGKMLEDSRTVSDYGMKFCPQLREPTLQLELRLRGGGCVTGGRFADVADLNAISHMAFSHNAPAWRVACPGLNVEGVCGTTGCRARGKMVIRGVGMGAFTLGDACACPLCRRPFAPVTCAFHACAWMFEGVKAGGGAALGGVWREAGDAYERFNTGADGESGGSMVEWERLVLVAKYRGRKRIPAADAAAAGGVAGEPAAALASGSGAQVDDCAVCLEPLHSWHVSLQAAVTPCGHVYHEACLKAWRRSSSASNGTCPSCRANL